MKKGEPAFVSFEPRNDGFVAFLSMERVVSDGVEPELLTRDAAKVYARSIGEMRSLVRQMRSRSLAREPIPARMTWEFGDHIFELVHALNRLGLQLDGMYDHLARDLDVKRKWLEKVVILRRYLPTKDLIPEAMNWGRLEKGTRKKSERLRRGLRLD